MGTPNRTIRGLLALGLAVGLVAAACSSSSPGAINGINGSNGNNGNNGLGGNNAGATGSLTSGLAANLDKLDSYQFSWQFSSTETTATSADTGSLTTSGTVINKPVKSYQVNDLGMFQVIVIGAKGWTSYDNGTTWTADTTYSSDSSALQALLPVSLYGSDFDTNAGEFTAAGDETKNGIPCIHYTGNSSLGALGAIAGVNLTFKADLWVAKDGNYPVSGFYGWSGSSGGQGGSWGYSFDVKNVNSSSNKVTAPTNVVAAPSY